MLGFLWQSQQREWWREGDGCPLGASDEGTDTCVLLYVLPQLRDQLDVDIGLQQSRADQLQHVVEDFLVNHSFVAHGAEGVRDLATKVGQHHDAVEEAQLSFPTPNSAGR